jgi:hypothetical protein
LELHRSKLLQQRFLDMRKEREEVSRIAKHDCTRLGACVEDAGTLICKFSEVEWPSLSALLFPSGVVAEHTIKDSLFVRLLLQRLVEIEMPNGSLRKTFDKLALVVLARIHGAEID